MTPRVRLYACIAAANHGTTIQRAMGGSLSKPDVLARKEVMQRLHGDGLSLSQIGRMVNRNHATVMHSLGLLSRGDRRKPKAETARTEWPEYNFKSGGGRENQPMVWEGEDEAAARIASRPPVAPCFRCGVREGCAHR